MTVCPHTAAIDRAEPRAGKWLRGLRLGDLFGKLVVATRTDELCAQGWLHRPKVWTSKAPDLRGVRVVAGDYSVSALAQRSNTVELNADKASERWNEGSPVLATCFAMLALQETLKE